MRTFHDEEETTTRQDAVAGDLLGGNNSVPDSMESAGNETREQVPPTQKWAEMEGRCFALPRPHRYFAAGRTRIGGASMRGGAAPASEPP
ncbi:MAG: hypothetical protein ABIZ49_10365 [Opitutaceae bacterium]